MCACPFRMMYDDPTWSFIFYYKKNDEKRSQKTVQSYDDLLSTISVADLRTEAAVQDFFLDSLHDIASPQHPLTSEASFTPLPLCLHLCSISTPTHHPSQHTHTSAADPTSPQHPLHPAVHPQPLLHSCSTPPTFIAPPYHCIIPCTYITFPHLCSILFICLAPLSPL